jgi:hypothetical protein
MICAYYIGAQKSKMLNNCVPKEIHSQIATVDKSKNKYNFANNIKNRFDWQNCYLITTSENRGTDDFK